VSLAKRNNIYFWRYIGGAQKANPPRKDPKAKPMPNAVKLPSIHYNEYRIDKIINLGAMKSIGMHFF